MADAAKEIQRNRGHFTVVFFCIASLFLLRPSTATGDAVTTAKPLRDGGAAVVSAGGVFELGFFSPGSSKNRYLGIWYAGISPLTTVWVANRAAPLADSSGVLRLTADGALLLLNRTNGVVWSSNSSSTAAGKARINNTPVARLLDSGNLQVVSADPAAAKDQNDSILWESFDDPTDTLLPGLKLGRRRASGPDRFLTPWKSPDDPAPGELRFGVDPHRYEQLGLSRGSEPLFFSGPWNGVGFSGTLGFRANQLFKFVFVNNERERYQFYYFEPFNRSLITRYLINATGESQWWNWNDHGWFLFLSVTYDNCYRYALCGAYTTCNSNDLPICQCLDGFVPRSQAEWDSANWSGGCVRKTPLGCGVRGGGGGGDGFLKVSGAKLPDTLRSWYNGSMNLEECRSACLRNCSCTAYAASDIRGGGSGCLIWFGGLIDIRYTFDNGQDFYMRMAASELDQGTNVKRNSGSRAKKPLSIIVCTVAVTGIVLASVAIYVYKKRQQWKQQLENEKASQGTQRGGETEKDNFELPLFDSATISYATDNFSFRNKLGEGGFGPVYKGILKDGLEIAVKRLSKGSNQGLHEFKNEVMHIAKLQHRNLVKLLGCCFQVDEMMLVYEYMSNNSLDSHMFDQAKSTILDWSERFHIINGIARGLLYLHHDSRLRIIHRDLKASNILLDKEMNPKISDFGMAKCFGGNETVANTKRVVGTYGYMAPEYAIDGCYSTKSDVFSFGVLVLEIVSGKKNRGFDHPDHSLNLLGHAWKLQMEDRSLEVIDESIKISCNPYEAMRAIHLGLLCVQQHPDDRPSMSSVVLFLGTDTALPPPKQPGFFMERDPYGADFSSGKESYSANKMSITLLEAR